MGEFETHHQRAKDIRGPESGPAGYSQNGEHGLWGKVRERGVLGGMGGGKELEIVNLPVLDRLAEACRKRQNVTYNLTPSDLNGIGGQVIPGLLETPEVKKTGLVVEDVTTSITQDTILEIRGKLGLEKIKAPVIVRVANGTNDTLEVIKWGGDGWLSEKAFGLLLAAGERIRPGTRGQIEGAMAGLNEALGKFVTEQMSLRGINLSGAGFEIGEDTVAVSAQVETGIQGQTPVNGAAKKPETNTTRPPVLEFGRPGGTTGSATGRREQDPVRSEPLPEATKNKEEAPLPAGFQAFACEQLGERGRNFINRGTNQGEDLYGAVLDRLSRAPSGRYGEAQRFFEGSDINILEVPLTSQLINNGSLSGRDSASVAVCVSIPGIDIRFSRMGRFSTVILVDRVTAQRMMNGIIEDPTRAQELVERLNGGPLMNVKVRPGNGVRILANNHELVGGGREETRFCEFGKKKGEVSVPRVVLVPPETPPPSPPKRDIVEDLDKKLAGMNAGELRQALLEVDITKDPQLYQKLIRELSERVEAVGAEVTRTLGTTLALFVQERAVRVLREGSAGAGIWKGAREVERGYTIPEGQMRLKGLLTALTEDGVAAAEMESMPENNPERKKTKDRLDRLQIPGVIGPNEWQNIAMQTDWSRNPRILFEDRPERMRFARIAAEHEEAAGLVDEMVDPDKTELRFTNAQKFWAMLTRAEKNWGSEAQKIAGSVRKLVQEVEYKEMVLEKKVEVIAGEVVNFINFETGGMETVYAKAVAAAVEMKNIEPENPAAKSIRQCLLLDEFDQQN